MGKEFLTKVENSDNLTELSKVLRETGYFISDYSATITKKAIGLSRDDVQELTAFTWRLPQLNLMLLNCFVKEVGIKNYAEAISIFSAISRGSKVQGKTREDESPYTFYSDLEKLCRRAMSACATKVFRVSPEAELREFKAHLTGIDRIRRNTRGTFPALEEFAKEVTARLAKKIQGLYFLDNYFSLISNYIDTAYFIRAIASETADFATLVYLLRNKLFLEPPSEYQNLVNEAKIFILARVRDLFRKEEHGVSLEDLKVIAGCLYEGTMIANEKLTDELGDYVIKAALSLFKRESDVIHMAMSFIFVKLRARFIETYLSSCKTLTPVQFLGFVEMNIPDVYPWSGDDAYLMDEVVDMLTKAGEKFGLFSDIDFSASFSLEQLLEI